ncbi:hypothetical protein, partial [Paenibacillus xylanexedens]|uniref:hypothetical protein n=1 Tax=Paenibacillus xylanexedens TaxID=528191 RepID=UPI001C92EBE7
GGFGNKERIKRVGMHLLLGGTVERFAKGRRVADVIEFGGCESREGKEEMEPVNGEILVWEWVWGLK